MQANAPTQFMKVSDYVTEMDQMKATLGPGITFVKDRANRGGWRRDYLSGRSKAWSTGPSRSSSPAAPVRSPSPRSASSRTLTETSSRSARSPRGYGEILDSLSYVTSPQPAGKIVVIYGGQPTSAWAVAHAIASRAGYICWLARSGITDEANPVGRNDAVMRIAKEEGYMQKGEILSIDVRNDVRPVLEGFVS